MSEENESQENVPEEGFAADSEFAEQELEESPPKKPAGGLKFLTLLMMIAAVGLIAFPFIWGLADRAKVTPDSSVLNDWLYYLGDWHVLILHLPIGLFFYVFAMEIFAVFSFGKFKPRLRGALLLTSLTAILAVVTGYFMFLRGEHGAAPLEFDWEKNGMGMHMWLSILFAVFVILAFVSKMWAHHQQKWSPFYPLFILIAAAALGIGAHNGGELVHKNTDIVGDFVKLKNGESLGVIPEAQPDVTAIPAGERLVYAEVVKPILAGKCWECHAPAELNPLGKDKIKGDLDMTTVANLLKGGESAIKHQVPTLVPGDSADSDLLNRTNLDLDDDEFMPKGKEDEPEMHFTDGEKRILTWWIESTPLIDEATDKPLSEVEGHEAILADVEAFVPVQVVKVEGGIEGAVVEEEETPMVPEPKGAEIGASLGGLGGQPVEEAVPEEVMPELEIEPSVEPEAAEPEADMPAEEELEVAPEAEAAPVTETMPEESSEEASGESAPEAEEEASEEAMEEVSEEPAESAPVPEVEEAQPTEEESMKPADAEESSESAVEESESAPEPAPAPEEVEVVKEGEVVEEESEMVPTEGASEVVEKPESAPTPKEEQPETEQPKTEEPKTEEPKTEEPKTEEPKTEEPKKEEAATPAPEPAQEEAEPAKEEVVPAGGMTPEERAAEAIRKLREAASGNR